MWDLSAISMFSVVGRNQKVIFTPRTKFRNVLGDRRTEETIFFYFRRMWRQSFFDLVGSFSCSMNRCIRMTYFLQLDLESSLAMSTEHQMSDYIENLVSSNDSDRETIVLGLIY